MIKILLLNLLSLILGVEQPGVSPRAELLFVGDAMQHQAQLDKAKEIGIDHYDYSGCFDLIAPDILSSDYAICNLEVPLGGGPEYSGYPCFSAPDSFAESLNDVGFNFMFTANNHCLDRRDKAARRTIMALDSLNINHTGTFLNAGNREDELPNLINVNGFKIGVLNYTYGTNGIEPTEGVEIALIDKEKIAKEVKKTRESGAEIIIVGMHWGIEYVLLENKIQRNLSDFLLSLGVDLVIGSHPHVVQPMKIVENPVSGRTSLIVYSLGNFISNMKTADTRGGALARVNLKRDDKNQPYIDFADYDIFFSAKPEGNDNFRIYPSRLAPIIPLQQYSHWEIFKRGALKVFNEHNIKVNQRPN